MVIKCQYNEVWLFFEGFAGVCKDGKWGFINKDGEEVIKCQYDDGDYFSNGIALVEKNNWSYYIDTEGNVL